jgi:hypothetical protein
MAVRMNAHPTKKIGAQDIGGSPFMATVALAAARMNAHPTKKIGAQDIVGSPFMATVALAAARLILTRE